MGEIAQFVRHGATKITPRILKGLHKKAALLKLKFSNINDPKYPHLPGQLQFLANVMEDFVDGEAEELPYITAAAAAFAVLYCHQQFDLIPDWVPDFGLADDSSVVRAVLIEHEKHLAAHAEKLGLRWQQISVEP